MSKAVKNYKAGEGMKVNIAGLQMKNPVITASGTFGYGEEYADYIDLNLLGGISVKGLSLAPRAGNPPPRIMETTGGMLNSVGLQNIGVDAFIEEKIPFLRKFDVAVIANIYGESYADYAAVAAKLDGARRSRAGGEYLLSECSKRGAQFRGRPQGGGRGDATCPGEKQPAPDRQADPQCHGHYRHCACGGAGGRRCSFAHQYTDRDVH